MNKNRSAIGFLPDFSQYLYDDFPLSDAYHDIALITKVGEMIKMLLLAKNPMRELQDAGVCHKFEKMTKQADKKFFKICTQSVENFAVLQLYYASFGNNGRGVVVGFNTTTRFAYFLAVDTHHKIRQYHGKFG